MTRGSRKLSIPLVVAAQIIPSLSSNRVNGIAGQAFRSTVMLYNITPYSKQPVADRAYPEAAVAIEGQSLDGEFAAIEFRRDERLEDAIH